MQRGASATTQAKPGNPKTIKELRDSYEAILKRFLGIYGKEASEQCKSLLLELYPLAHSCTALEVKGKAITEKRRLDVLIKILILRIDVYLQSANKDFVKARLERFCSFYDEQKVLNIGFDQDGIYQQELFALAQLFSYQCRHIIVLDKSDRLQSVSTEIFEALKKRTNDAFLKLLSVYCVHMFEHSTMMKSIDLANGSLLENAWRGVEAKFREEEN